MLPWMWCVVEPVDSKASPHSLKSTRNRIPSFSLNQVIELMLDTGCSMPVEDSVFIVEIKRETF